MTEQEAIERIRDKLSEVQDRGWYEDDPHGFCQEMARLAWDEMKTIALEQRVDLPSLFKTAYGEQVRQVDAARLTDPDWPPKDICP